MTPLQLLRGLEAAGVSTVALDSVAEKVRWQGGDLTAELRAALAQYKPTLLLLARGEAFTAPPSALLSRLIDSSPAARREWFRLCRDAPIPPPRPSFDALAAD